MNAQSARNKFDDIQCYVKENNCDILVITETWFYSNQVNQFHISGYSSTHSCRNSKGGGSSIYIKDSIDYSIETTESTSNDRSLNFVSINLLGCNIRLCALYRPPSLPFIDFIMELDEILNKNNWKTILIGDMNVNLLKNTAPEVTTYKNTITINGFKICNKINEKNATRVTAQSKTLIDHVISNNQITCDVRVSDKYVSDHNILEISVVEKVKTKEKKIRKNHLVLNQSLFKQKFEEASKNTKIYSFELLVSVIQACKKEATNSYKLKHRDGNDWITKEFLDLMKKRDRLYKLKINNPFDQIIQNQFRIQKNIVNKKRKLLKKEFFEKQWEKTGRNNKKQWKFINDMVKGKSANSEINHIEKDGEKMCDPKDIASTFNNYFINIGKSIADNIDNINNYDTINFEEIWNNNSIILCDTNEREIIETLNELNKNAAAGHDQINTKDILTLKINIVPVLVLLINEIFHHGIYPEILKIGKVIPLHKSGSTKGIDNYRPITMVSCLSKLIEKIIKKRIVTFINKDVKFDRYQYGFQENSSTLSATSDVVNYISSKLDGKYFVLTVFIDLRKAFDVVDHKILLKKIENMGIRGNLLTLLTTYLLNREQYVSLGNNCSDVQQTNYGVPQGSVLGPFLYTLLVRSLEKAKLRAKYFTFADDTILVYKSTDSRELEIIVNNDLEKYQGWLINNKLQINLKKTTYMLFMQKNMNAVDMHIKIGNETINRVDSAKYLGLILDENINWSKHVQHIEKKVVPMIGALYRCRDYLNNKTLKLIYNAYFLPIFSYLIPVWGTCGNTLINKTQRIQNKVVKILFNFSYRTSTDVVFKETGLLQIADILKIEQSKFLYKVINNNFKCNSQLEMVNNIHTHDTRRQNTLYINNIRTNIALNSPLIRSIKTFNSLPQSIRNSSDYNQYKNKIKMYFQQKD